MSVSFGKLNITNGLASRLLRGIRYAVGESNDGSMEVEAMLAGITSAKATVDPEDAEYLDMLEAEEHLAAKARGEVLFAWF